MSLRMLGWDEGQTRRRVATSARLSAVLGQGLVDHRDELEKRLKSAGVPMGPSGYEPFASNLHYCTL